MKDDLLNLTFSRFFFNKEIYGLQNADGSYSSKSKPISFEIFSTLILSNNGVLCYQVKENQIQWVCFDFDIAKNLLVDGLGDKHQFEILKDYVNSFLDFIESKKLSCLTEFSGRRGFHAWIIFDKPIDLNDGYLFVLSLWNEFIEVNSLPYGIEMDLFPSTNKKTKIGKGVRVPLSINRKSECVSYFIEKKIPTDITQLLKKCLSNEELQSQYEILKNYRLVSVDDISTIKSKTSIDNIKQFRTLKKIILKDNYSETDVFKDLSQCSSVKAILEEANRSGQLSEAKRKILVSLLNRVVGDDEEKKGHKILVNFFSKLEKFNETLTMDKLKDYQVYPANCNFINSVTGVPCSCANVGISSPIEYVRADYLESASIFDLSTSFLQKVRITESKYLFQNDEVASNLIYYSLKNLDVHNIQNLFSNFQINLELEDVDYYIRNEKDKKRTLVSLNASNRFISTICLILISRLFNDCINPNSYSYRVQNNLMKNSLFGNWSDKWNEYKKRIESLMHDPNYKDYSLLKIDVKEYYPSVDLRLLEEKLLNGPSKKATLILEKLTGMEASFYKNICSQLISLTKKIQNSNLGLPQGPAYARYFAELYFLEIDDYLSEILEGNGVFYRYVDDIFIFTKLKNDEALELKSEIEKKFTLHSLKFNSEKCFFGSVEEFLPQFENYFNNSNYVIDFVSKNYHASSNEAKTRARDEFRRVLFSSMNGKINDDFLNFGLSHLLADGDLNKDREMIVNEVLKNDYYRGAVYSKAIRHILKNGRDEDLKLLMGLEGLKKLCLIATLSSFLKNNPTSKGKLEIVVEDIIKSTTYEHSEAKLISILILLYYPQKLNSIATKLEPTIIFKSISVLPLATRNDHVLEGISQSLNPLEMGPFLDVCMKLVSSSDVDKNINLDILNKFSSKLKFIIGRDIEFDFLKIEGRINLGRINNFYQMLSMLTLYSTNFEEWLQKSWKKLISEIDKYNVKNEFRNDWIQYLGKNDFSSNALSMLLASITKGEIVSGTGKTGVVLSSKLLVGVMTSLLGSENEISLKDAKIAYLSLPAEKKSIFFDWIFNIEDVQLFPDHTSAMRLISLSDRTVLQKRDEILVRVRETELHKTISPHLKSKYIDSDSITGATYHNYVFKLDPNDIKSLKQVFDPQSLSFKMFSLQILEMVKKHYELLDVFGLPERAFNSYSHSDFICKSDSLPLIPLSALDKYISFGSEDEIANDSVYFINRLFELLNKNFVTSKNTEYLLRDFFLKDSFVDKKHFDGFIDKLNYALNFLTSCPESESDADVLFLDNLRFKLYFQFFLQRYSKGIDHTSLDQSKKNEIVRLTFNEYLTKFNMKSESVLKMTILPDVTKFESLYCLKSYFQRMLDKDNGFLDFELLQFIDQEFTRVASEIQSLTGVETLEAELLNSLKLVELSVPVTGTYKLFHKCIWSLNTSYVDYKKVSVLRLFGRDREVEAPGSGLDRLDQYLFAAEVNTTSLVIVVADNIIKALISKSYERHELRKIQFEKEGKIYSSKLFRDEDAAKLNFMAKTTNFQKSVEVVKYNQAIDTIKAEELLLNWLWAFPLELHLPLLNLIASHYLPSFDLEQRFFSDLREYLLKGCFLFHHKAAEDLSGFVRLISDQKDLIEYFRKTCNGNLELDFSKPLCIVSDICLSGGQIENSFNDYFFSNSLEREVVKTANRLRSINTDEQVLFRSYIDSQKQIVFIFKYYTDAAAVRLRKYFKSKFDKEIVIVGSVVPFENFRFTTSSLVLEKDKDLIRTFFVNKQNLLSIFSPSDCDEIIRNMVGNKNLFIRKHSLTRMGFAFFEVPQLKTNKPLLSKIK